MEARLAAGLELCKIDKMDGRNSGFIEYIPCELDWRAVNTRLLDHLLFAGGRLYPKWYAKNTALSNP